MDLRAFLILPPLALGVAGFLWMTGGDGPPAARREPVPLAVRVETVVPRDTPVTATGFGRVAAVRDFRAVAEVPGRIADMAAGLADGSIVDRDALLLAVDPTDYDIAMGKARANLAAAEAALDELDRQDANTQRSLDLARRILGIAQDEYDRTAQLVGTGAGTRSALDAAQRAVLAQETAVTELENTLALLPSRHAAAVAARDLRSVELAEAERARDKTRITAPFRGRVSALGVETGQFVRAGDPLLTLDDISAVEIIAEMQPQSLAPIVQAALGATLRAGRFDTSRIVEALAEAGVTATVRQQVAGFDAAYRAQMVRSRGTLDDGTGTLGIVVRVDDPLAANRDTATPPLNVGAFVSVDLVAPPVRGMITIPRAALRQDDDGGAFVYLADADDRLALRPVTPGAVLGARVAIRAGLAAGDRVILSDPQPPLPGMPVTPVATGEGG